MRVLSRQGVVVICVLTLLNSCLESSKQKTMRLFETLNDSIDRNAQSEIDSLFYKKHTRYILKNSFSKGKLIKSEYYTLDTSKIKAVTKFDRDGIYEKRNELDSNGTIRTNGIVLSGKYYGPWEINHPNSSKRYRGYRYASENFGKGIYFTKDGKIERIVHYGNEHLFDSLIVKFGQ